MARREVKITEAIALLKDGYSRWEKDAQERGKSLQTYYELSFSQMKTLQAHPGLKGIRMKKMENTINIVDDRNATVTAQPAPVETVNTDNLFI